MLWVSTMALALPVWMSFGRLFVGVGGWLTLMLMMFVFPFGGLALGIALFLIFQRASRVRPMAVGRFTAWTLILFIPCALIAPLTLGDYGDAQDSAVSAPLITWGVPEHLVSLLAWSWLGALGGMIAVLIAAIVDYQDRKHP